MLRLDADHIRLGCAAAGKEAAIRMVGTALVDAGFIEPAYVESMLERERTVSTFLGNGIAIPHGLPAARHLVRATGIVVLQFPDGVDWGDHQRVQLAVGIAATSNEHLSVISNLTGILGEGDAGERLGATRDVAEILAAVNREPHQSEPAPDGWSGGASIQVESPSPHGLHARPATVLVEVAKRYRSEIVVRVGDRIANAKSLVSLLSLGAAAGTPMSFLSRGDDALAALQAIGAVFEAGFDEDDDQGFDEPDRGTAADYEGRVLPGLAASPGVVAATAWMLQRERLVVTERAPDPIVQRRRLEQALAGAATELHRIHDELARRIGPSRAAIFRAHIELVEDPDLVGAAQRIVGEGHSAGWAWRRAFEERAAQLAALPDPLLAARAEDLRDVGRRVLRSLADSVESQAAPPSEPVVLVADDLTPSDTARLDPTVVLGLCTASGGATSHTAIIARSLDIPAVVAIGPALLDLDDGELCILDGDTGVVVVQPTERDLARAAERQSRARVRHEAERLDRYKPAVTRDGHRIEVVANIGRPDEAQQAVEAGAEGVGLVRTEFAFLGRNDAPNEDEQAEAYATMVRALHGKPLVLRTLDIGGDKRVSYLPMPTEHNPALGVRGIRLCFEREDLFRTQLRAIYRAAEDGPVRMMFPMIATLGEVARARAIADAVRVDLGAAPIEIGVMIEVPSAVMMADELAREVDFFSIGSNDLTQYVLAMDRQHPVLSAQADGMDPAVLRMIERAVASARRAGIWTSACGGIAGDPVGTVVLAGLGVTELSVSIPSVAATKALVRSLTLADAEDLARRALACRSAADVRALVAGATA